MMKGIYLSNIDPEQSFGYMPKILGQVKGLTQLGIDMELVCFNADSKISLVTCLCAETKCELSVEILGSAGGGLLIRRLNLFKSTLRQISINRPDFLYLRYPRSEPLYLWFLFRVRMCLPEIIILSEFPTFPYDAEYKRAITVKDKLVFGLDKLTRKYLKYFLDQIIAINYERPIFEIPAISIDNGINVADYAVRAKLQDSNHPVICLIGVANVSPWHGYDRILKGLADYLKRPIFSRRKVIFHIVVAR
ncbi:MAG: hypothetical protein F6K11_35770 [Leptolyngbya sp. SIO3F4]|nr:hypothetical protein [Leptolyngbya sp. SIO3F4]